MLRLSIIIPVYNSEKYIRRCLDSILKTSISNYEIIVINDGSKDSSKEIIESYADRYNNIRLIDQENMGVALTRNRGIDLAKGKYIMFVDNDDYVGEGYVEHYLNTIEATDADIVMGGYERVDSNNKIIHKERLKNTEWAKYQITAPWAKVYKRNFITGNNIQFLNVNIGEDVYFNLQAISKTNNIVLIDDVNYKWFYNEKSVSNTIQKKIEEKLQVEDLLNNIYEVICKDRTVDSEIEYYFIRYVCWYILYIMPGNSKALVSSECDRMFAWLQSHFPNYLNNENLSVFKPVGDSFKNRLAVSTLVLFKKWNKEKLLISALCGRI